MPCASFFRLSSRGRRVRPSAWFSVGIMESKAWFWWMWSPASRWKSGTNSSRNVACLDRGWRFWGTSTGTLLDVFVWKSYHFNSFYQTWLGQGQITPGQAILEVNGVTETTAMLQEFRDAKRVEVLINPQLTPEQHMVFKSSVVKHQRTVRARDLLRVVQQADMFFFDVSTANCSRNVREQRAITILG